MVLLVFILFGAACLGACLGSFLNVCIYRIPAGLSIVFPPSHCTKCKQRILWRNNIPIVSYLLLRGRCRACGAPYSPRYMLIELLTGVLFAWFCYVDVLTPIGVPWPLLWMHWLYHVVMVAGLIVASFIDLDHYEIPDAVTLPMMVFGIGGAAVLSSVQLVPFLSAIPRAVHLLARSEQLWYAAGVGMGALLWAGWLIWFWRRRHHIVPGAAEWVMLAVWLAFLVLHGAALGFALGGRPAPSWLTGIARLGGLWASVVGLLAGAGSIWLVRLAGNGFLRCKRRCAARRARRWRIARPHDPRRGRRRARSQIGDRPPRIWAVILFGTKRITRWQKLGPWIAKEAMGFGDVTLMAAIGAFLGWEGSLWVFPVLSPVLALAVHFLQWLARGQRLIPFGPYLSLAALVAVLFWPSLWAVTQTRIQQILEIAALIAGN